MFNDYDQRFIIISMLSHERKLSSLTYQRLHNKMLFWFFLELEAHKFCFVFEFFFWFHDLFAIVFMIACRNVKGCKGPTEEKHVTCC